MMAVHTHTHTHNRCQLLSALGGTTRSAVGAASRVERQRHMNSWVLIQAQFRFPELLFRNSLIMFFPYVPFSPTKQIANTDVSSVFFA